jgi:glycine/sarcosine N-methyltransferase
MDIENTAFYDRLAASYHLIFEDWQDTIVRQAAVIARLLEPPSKGPILDCACGIGTQVLGLAALGYSVEGSDVSRAEIARAIAEAASRKLTADFRVDDMRTLITATIGRYAAVLAFDNALPHLDSDEDVQKAITTMRDKLQPAGQLLISLRDYGPLISEHPATMPPRVFGNIGERRIVHQVWDWRDQRRYVLHLFITIELKEQQWVTHHFVGRYRAVTPGEVARLAEQSGFRQVKVLDPIATGYYQPIVCATR